MGPGSLRVRARRDGQAGVEIPATAAPPLRTFSLDVLYQPSDKAKHYFVDVDDATVERIIRPVINGGMVLLYGPRYCGKSSIACESVVRSGTAANFLRISIKLLSIEEPPPQARADFKFTSDVFWTRFNLRVKTYAAAKGMLVPGHPEVTASPDWATTAFRKGARPHLLIEDWDWLLELPLSVQLDFLEALGVYQALPAVAVDSDAKIKLPADAAGGAGQCRPPLLHHQRGGNVWSGCWQGSGDQVRFHHFSRRFRLRISNRTLAGKK